eukprot:3214922-Rhodomonas_salina.1
MLLSLASHSSHTRADAPPPPVSSSPSSSSQVLEQYGPHYFPYEVIHDEERGALKIKYKVAGKGIDCAPRAINGIGLRYGTECTGKGIDCGRRVVEAVGELSGG